MKLAILTDIHANREAFETCLDAARRAGAQRFALLGDFVGYGADPAWVVSQVAALVSQGAIAVRGNHDEAAVIGPAPTMVGDALRVVEWTSNQLTAPQREFLAGLPYTAKLEGALFAHANAHRPEEWNYVTDCNEAARCMHATSARHTFIGHMHDPRLFRGVSDSPRGKAEVTEIRTEAGVATHLSSDYRWLVVPGSAGQPRDGNTAACWALFDTQSGMVTFQRQAYDHEKAAAKIVCAGLPRTLAQRLLRGT